MNISFSNPWGLLLLAALPLFWWIARDGLRYMRPLRRWLTLSLRLLLVALLVVSFAGIQAVQAVNNLAVVFLLDRSDSLPAAAQAQQLVFLNRAMAQLSPADRAAVVVFAQEAMVERPLTAPAPLAEVKSQPHPYYTDLAAAVRLGTALFPAASQKRIVVLSDGNENLDSALEAAQLAASNGIAFSAVNFAPQRSADSSEVSVEDLTAPPSVRQGEQFSLNVVVNSTRKQPARLSILRGEQLIRVSPVELNVGRNTFRQEVTVAQKGLATFRVQIATDVGGDTVAQNNSYSAFSFVQGNPSVLLVSNQASQSRPLLIALRAAGIEARAVTAAFCPPTVTELASFDAIVLDNVAADTLPAGAAEAIQSYVRDLGRGLIALGGDESFALGGYFRSPLEDTLPINMNLPNRMSEANTAVMLVIDHSGSMDERTTTGARKMDLAIEAAKQAVANLGVDDVLGVIAFDNDHYNVVRLRPVDDAVAIQQAISTINVAGGTNMWGALNPAIDALGEAAAKSKTIILLTDGISDPGDVAVTGKAAFDAGITITTIGLGDFIDKPTLEELSRRTGGRFYQSTSGNDLPKIFTKETRMAARSYLNERPFTPALVGVSPIMRGLTGQPLPRLYGYVGSSVKPLASLILASDNGDPILAAWQYGLGRAVAWTSDGHGQWAADWVTWPQFSTFWSQAVRWTMPGQAATSLQPLVAINDNSGHVQVDALGGTGYLNNLEVNASVVGPDRLTDTVTLRQSAPGRYEADFPLRGEGVYLVGVRAGGIVASSVTVSGTQVQRSTAFSETQTLGLAVPYSPEYRQSGGNESFLRRLISLGLPNLQAGAPSQLLLNPGDDPAPLAAHNLKAQASSSDLWPYTLAAAILLLPLDVGVRRVAVGLSELENWFNRRRRRRQPVTVGVSDGTALFAAKQRAGQRTRASSASSTAQSLPTNLVERANVPLDKDSTIRLANQSGNATPPDASGESLSSQLLRNQQERRRD